MRKPSENKFDFIPVGKAFKASRISKGLTQDNVAEAVGIELQYYATIENNGQYPSVQLLHDLVQLLRVSLDEFFLPSVKRKKSSRRNAVEDLMDQLSDADLIILEGTIKGIIGSKVQ